MKKAFAALLILSMLLSALAVAEAADAAGTWYLIEIQSEGQSLSPADLGMSMTLELKADGTVTATTSMDDEVGEGTWEANGDKVTITINDDPQEFTLADGKLTADEDGMIMVFSQEEPAANAFTPAAAVEAEEADFAGVWTAERIGLEGQYYPVSILGADVTATIEGTTITLDGFMFSNTSMPLEFADGKLSFSGSDDESGITMGITATLLEDGMLALDLDAGESGAFTFYMNRAEASEEAPAA